MYAPSKTVFLFKSFFSENTLHNCGNSCVSSWQGRASFDFHVHWRVRKVNVCQTNGGSLFGCTFLKFALSCWPPHSKWMQVHWHHQFWKRKREKNNIGPIHTHHLSIVDELVKELPLISAQFAHQFILNCQFVSGFNPPGRSHSDDEFQIIAFHWDTSTQSTFSLLERRSQNRFETSSFTKTAMFIRTVSVSQTSGFQCLNVRMLCLFWDPDVRFVTLQV